MRGPSPSPLVGVALVAQLCLILCDPMDCSLPSSSRLLCPWDFPGKNSGVGCHSLLQRIFPTQGSSPGLLHWQVDSSPSEPPGKPETPLLPLIRGGRCRVLGGCVGGHRPLSPRASLVAQTLKNLPASVGDTGDLSLIPGEGDGNPASCSCLESPMDRGAWGAAGQSLGGSLAESRA